MSNYRKKYFLVLTSGNFLKALGSGIGTCSVFCHSFSFSNNVSAYKTGWVKKDSSFQKAKEAIEFCVSMGIAVTIGQKFVLFLQVSNSQIVSPESS